MKNESVKKSLENPRMFQKKSAKRSSKNIALQKTNTFTIIGTNFVREQLKANETFDWANCYDKVQTFSQKYKPAQTEVADPKLGSESGGGSYNGKDP